MNPEELPLRDIHLPDSVSWWPLAPGWWLLLAIAVVIALLVWAIRQGRTRLKLRKQALQELDYIQSSFRQHQDLCRLASECSILLRRVALSRFDREDVAGLTGEQWIDFLNQQAGEDIFSDTLLDILSTAPYRVRCDYNAATLLSACERWLNQLPADQGRPA